MNIIKRQSDKLGMTPGSYVLFGKQKQDQVEINLMDYNEDSCEFKFIDTIDEALSYSSNKNITWINIYGLHEQDILKKIENHFNIHLLVMEDILNTVQRPKIEIYDDYIFVSPGQKWAEPSEESAIKCMREAYMSPELRKKTLSEWKSSLDGIL